MHTICAALILNIVMNVYLTDAYAQLADTMLCADKECSETISEGKARLAYRPRDDKFLNLEKGDVVLVKSKNAGKKSHLWGGQVMGSDRFGFFPSSFIKEYIELVKKPKYNVSIKEFLKGVNGHKSPDLYAGLIGENQRITVDKSKKKKSTAQSDSEEDPDGVNVPSSPAGVGSTEAKTNTKDVNQIPNEAADHDIDDSVSKQDGLSAVEGNRPKPSDDQPSTESVDKLKNLEVTDKNDAEKIRSSTPLPPHIAAIMEESLKSSQRKVNTQDDSRQENVGHSKEHVDHIEDAAKLEDEEQHKHSADDYSSATDSQLVQPDRPIKAKELSPAASMDSDGMRVVHGGNQEEVTVGTAEESGDDSSAASSESRNIKKTMEPSDEKEHVNLWDKMKSAEMSQPMNDHIDVPLSNAEMKHEETPEVEDQIEDGKTVDNVATGNVAAVKSTNYPGTDGQSHANLNDTTTSNELNSQPAKAESINGGKNDTSEEDQKTAEDSIANGQELHSGSATDAGHSKENEGSYKLTISTEESNLGSEAEAIHEDDGPFEDDTDDDFEIEYLVMGREKKNEHQVTKPQSVEDDDDAVGENVKSNSESDEEQNAAESQKPMGVPNAVRHSEPEHVKDTLENETVSESENPNAEGSALYSMSNLQVEEGISLDNDSPGSKPEPIPEEASDSNENLSDDNNALEPDEKKDTLPTDERETDEDTTDGPRLSGETIGEDKQMPYADDGPAQFEKLGQNELQNGTVDSESETPRQTGESDVQSGTGEMEQKEGTVSENTPADSPQGEPGVIGEDKSGWKGNEDAISVTTDDISMWNITEQENPSDTPKADLSTSAEPGSPTAVGGNDVAEDILKSGLAEAIDSPSTSTNNVVNKENAVSIDLPSDTTTGTDKPPSSSEVEAITSDIEENSDDGVSLQDELPSEESIDNDQSHFPKDNASEVSLGKGGSPNDESKIARTNDPLGGNESNEDKEFGSKESDGQGDLPSEPPAASSGHVLGVTSDVSQNGGATSSDETDKTGTKDSDAVDKLNRNEETGSEETDGQDTLVSERSEDSKQPQMSNDNLHLVFSNVSKNGETSSDSKPDTTITHESVGTAKSDEQDELPLEKSEDSESEISTNDSGGTTSKESGDEEVSSTDVPDKVRSNGPAADVETEEIADVIKTDSDTTGNSILKTDLSSNLDVAITEEDTLESQRSSAQVADDENDIPESPDELKQQDSTLHTSHLPPPGPPPKSFHGKEEKQTGEVKTEDPNESAESRSNVSGNKVQGSDDTFVSPITTEDALEEKEESSNKDGDEHDVNSVVTNVVDRDGENKADYVDVKSLEKTENEHLVLSGLEGAESQKDIPSNKQDVLTSVSGKQSSAEEFTDKTSAITPVGSLSVDNNYAEAGSREKQAEIELDGDKEAVYVQSVHSRFTSLYDDIYIKWFLPKQSQIDPKQKQLSIGYTNLLTEPLMKWFQPRQSKGPGHVAERDTSDKVGSTDLYQDIMMKWFLPKVTVIPQPELSVEQIYDAKGITDLSGMTDNKGVGLRILEVKNREEIGFTNLYEDEKLKWFLPKFTVAPKLVSSHENTRTDPGFTNLHDDKLLKWVLRNAKCSALRSDKDEKYEDQDVNSITNLRKDELLKWFLRDGCLCKHCQTNSQRSVLSNVSSKAVSSYLDDPKLKWFFKNAMITRLRDEFVANHENSKNGHSRYADHPLLKWMFSQSAMSSQNWKNREVDTVIIQNSIDDEDECKDYFNDPILQNSFPGNPACEQRTKQLQKHSTDIGEDDVYDEPLSVIVNEPYTIESQDIPSQNLHFDNPLHEWPPLDDTKAKVTSVRNDASTITVQIGDEGSIFESDDAPTTQMNKDSSSLGRKLRNILSRLQHAYEHSATFRIGLSNLQRDLKLFIQVDKVAAKEFHFMIKKCRNDVINIEDEILADIREVSGVIYSIGLSEINLKNVAENTIPKYEEDLQNIKKNIDKALVDMNDIQKNLHAKLYENSDVNNHDKHFEESNDIDKLKEKLNDLDRKLAEKNTRSGELVEKMKLDAEYFKSRIMELEESLKRRMKDEEQQSFQYVEREKKIVEQIQSIKSTLAERDEKKQTEKKETEQVTEKLRELEAGLKLTVKSGQPLLERISDLESELAARKAQDQENAKLEKSEAIHLRSKIQSLERQLKKQRNIGNAKMLSEARLLKNKVRMIEKDLAEKAATSPEIAVHEDEDSQLKERIATLEAEFKERLSAISSDKKSEETYELKTRVLAMEERLQNQIEAADRMKNITIPELTAKKTEEATKIHRKRRSKKKSSLKKLRKDEILELLDSIFFQKSSTSDSVQSFNQSYVYSKEDHNLDVDFKCSVDKVRRRACGARHYTKEFCNALRCCWKPVPDDPSIPPCYFSLLQLDGLSKATNTKSDQASSSDNLEQLGGNDDSEAGKHKVLHEGKIFDWDETIEEKPKHGQPLTWDEAISDYAVDAQKEPVAEHDHIPGDELQRHPTPLQSKVYESTSDDVTLTPSDEEDIEQIEVTKPPTIQDFVQEHVEATQSPSILEPATEKKAENVITTEPQVAQDISISPLDLKVAEGGALNDAADDRLESNIVEGVDPEDSVVM